MKKNTTTTAKKKNIFVLEISFICKETKSKDKITTTISKEMYDEIINYKAESKKNGVKLTNKDILLKIQQFYNRQ